MSHLSAASNRPTLLKAYPDDSLRELDIELMRRLAPRVNVIPVIGKSDSLTPSELQAFKRRVMEDIEHYNIPVYNFPYDVEEDDDETIQDNSELRVGTIFWPLRSFLTAILHRP